MTPANRQVLVYALIATVVFVVIYFVYSRQGRIGGETDAEVEPLEQKPEPNKSPYPATNENESGDA